MPSGRSQAATDAAVLAVAGGGFTGRRFADPEASRQTVPQPRAPGVAGFHGFVPACDGSAAAGSAIQARMSRHTRSAFRPRSIMW